MRALTRLLPFNVLFYVRTAAPAVALTFDDGPHEDTTPQLLDVLRDHNAKATFFLIGAHVPGNESIVSRIVTEGHELAIHMMRDEPSVLLGKREFRRQLEEMESMLVPYGQVRWFRPGSGWFTPGMVRSAAKQGFRCVLATVAAMHDGGPGDGRTAQRLLDRIAPGSIVVLHEGCRERRGVVATTDRVLGELRQRDLAGVTVSDLVALRN